MTEETNTLGTKDYPVFDCDAHVNDPLAVWDEYVPKAKRDLVRDTYWRSESEAWLNGDTRVLGGGNDEYIPMYNPAVIAGPQMNVKIMRKLMAMMPLSAEQRAYLLHHGAWNAQERVKDLDLMGIDQVLVIPTNVLMHVPFAENSEGVVALCEAYNNWCHDWCAEIPDRLYGAVLLPAQHDIDASCREVERAAERKMPVALIRPFDARGAYPNAFGTPESPGPLDRLFRTLEDTGVVLGMHTFPVFCPEGRRAAPGLIVSPGELLNEAGVDSQTLSFVHEAQTWVAQMLLSGLLDRYPRLKMALFESNSQWIPYMLETCDRLFRLYANERRTAASRLPSEAFRAQCVISFESDEVQTMRMWDDFEGTGIWASDCYHHDGADAWKAIASMQSLGVPREAEMRLMGGTARDFYGIDGKLFVTEQPGPIARPDWFPQGESFEQWKELVARPRQNAAALAALGYTSAATETDPDAPISIYKDSTTRRNVRS